ncbi:hypothetical protein CVD28_24580 [Bacillus sp. M6-12]|uniref:hypothetical protein n=1 Tax=Bacillus sp. M6-12 TaxID=2054166 RepID=UPI000C76B4FE|nr:hypothetical protein [Bacillus sp. M6-12]PLS15059.1 hypothetical protein CVD28_24580 [Bacillus sp. M6-12]
MVLNENQIKKKRTEGTAMMILDLIKGLELTSMMSDIFMYTEDPVAKELIKRYELQLVGAFEDPEEFKKNLHMFYQDTASYIKKNKLYKEFYSFCYFVFSTLSMKRLEREKDFSYGDALNCYYNILFQQMNYFVPHPKIAYGLDTSGRLLLRQETFPNLDVIIMNAYLNNKKNFTKENLYKKYQKIGYNIRSEFDFQRYHSNDQLITNMTLVMAYFINEHTIQINPKEQYMVAEGIELPKRKVNTDKYKTLLQEKRYFIPKKGLLARYDNFKDIKEIYFQEVFTENRIVLLYKVTATNGKEFCGFYDNKLELFYSPWDSTDFGGIYHRAMENVILESYCYLTTDIDEKIKGMEIERRLYLKQEVPVLSTKPLPSVEFLYEEKDESEQSKNKEKQLRLFDKRNYKEGKVTIHPFVRRLPAGAKASDEAIALAKSYHYVLREGETFVRPFERTSYRKE